MAAFQVGGLCFAALWTSFEEFLIFLKPREAIKNTF
jgi:hypothetical protein